MLPLLALFISKYSWSRVSINDCNGREFASAAIELICAARGSSPTVRTKIQQQKKKRKKGSSKFSPVVVVSGGHFCCCCCGGFCAAVAVAVDGANRQLIFLHTIKINSNSPLPSKEAASAASKSWKCTSKSDALPSILPISSPGFRNAEEGRRKKGK